MQWCWRELRHWLKSELIGPPEGGWAVLVMLVMLVMLIMEAHDELLGRMN